MIEAGILTDDDPVELLEGWLVTKMPKKPPHRVATGLTRTALERHVPTGWYLDVQEPITTEDSEPEPDVVVVRGERRQYLDRHPGPQDAGLLVEVADTTLARDRTFKKRLFAQERVPVYWILNLVDRQVEVYTDPSGATESPDYQHQQIYREGEEVPLVIEGRELGRIPVRDLLP
jgi:Uma2 family endonuclease